jgi:hypothetical protein
LISRGRLEAQRLGEAGVHANLGHSKEKLLTWLVQKNINYICSMLNLFIHFFLLCLFWSKSISLLQFLALVCLLSTTSI